MPLGWATHSALRTQHSFAFDLLALLFDLLFVFFFDALNFLGAFFVGFLLLAQFFLQLDGVLVHLFRGDFDVAVDGLAFERVDGLGDAIFADFIGVLRGDGDHLAVFDGFEQDFRGVVADVFDFSREALFAQGLQHAHGAGFVAGEDAVEFRVGGEQFVGAAQGVFAGRAGVFFLDDLDVGIRLFDFVAEAVLAVLRAGAAGSVFEEEHIAFSAERFGQPLGAHCAAAFVVGGDVGRVIVEIRIDARVDDDERNLGGLRIVHGGGEEFCVDGGQPHCIDFLRDELANQRQLRFGLVAGIAGFENDLDVAFLRSGFSAFADRAPEFVRGAFGDDGDDFLAAGFGLVRGVL